MGVPSPQRWKKAASEAVGAASRLQLPCQSSAKTRRNSEWRDGETNGSMTAPSVCLAHKRSRDFCHLERHCPQSPVQHSFTCRTSQLTSPSGITKSAAQESMPMSICISLSCGSLSLPFSCRIPCRQIIIHDAPHTVFAHVAPFARHGFIVIVSIGAAACFFCVSVLFLRCFESVASWQHCIDYMHSLFRCGHYAWFHCACPLSNSRNCFVRVGVFAGVVSGARARSALMVLHRYAVVVDNMCWSGWTTPCTYFSNGD